MSEKLHAMPCQYCGKPMDYYELHDVNGVSVGYDWDCLNPDCITNDMED